MGTIGRIFGLKLQRKLLRDLVASKGLFLAVTAVIFLGVAFFGASFLGYRNMKTSYDYTYETLRFADFTVEVVEAPAEVVEELAAIPGVEAVIGRVNTDIPLTLPGDESKRVLARAISLPAGARPAVNDVKVESGSYFGPSPGNVLLVEKSFAEHHGLGPGDRLSLTIDGREVDFDIAGVVSSPEYIWPAKSRQEILVSPETFGVVFIPGSTMRELTGSASLNEFCFLVAEGSGRDMAIEAAASALAPYVVMDVVPQEDQASNAALSMDLQELGEIAEVFPLLFLIVGALATYILLTRVVQNQRSQIGLMRAVGYSRRQVLLHYLGFAIIIGVVGAVAGTAAGYLLSKAITGWYVGILGLPYTVSRMGWIEWMAVVEGTSVGILPCLIAGILPAYAASRLSPSEAMRAPAPTAGRKLLLERIFPFLIGLSSLWKVPLRNIFRNRRRSLYTIVGVAFGMALILVSASFIDTTDYFMDLQFNTIQKYDALVTFTESQPAPATIVGEVEDWQEVERAEPLLQVPVRLAHEDRTYSTLALGLSPGSQMMGLVSPNGDTVALDGGGVVLSDGLRNTLNVDAGDSVSLLSPWGSSTLEVTAFVNQPMGSYAYLALDRAQALVGGLPIVNGLMLDVAPGSVDSIRERAQAIPGAASVELTAESNEKVAEMMGFIKVMSWVMLAFGAALALAIVFTTVTVSILERRREIATMRTLGEGRGRIAAMLTIENVWLGLAGVIPGIPLGYLLARFLFSLFESDMMTFDPVIFVRTYLLTVAIIIAIMLVSQIPGIRQINRMSLAQVVKEQAT